MDNGSEFAGRLMDMWAYHNGVGLDFSRPGNPTDYRIVESLNGSLRDECLNVTWFTSLAEAQGSLKARRQACNESLPNSALNELTPTEYARRIKEMGPAWWPRDRPGLALQVARRVQADQTEPSNRNEWLDKTGQVKSIQVRLT